MWMQSAAHVIRKCMRAQYIHNIHTYTSYIHTNMHAHIPKQSHKPYCTNRTCIGTKMRSESYILHKSDMHRNDSAFRIIHCTNQTCMICAICIMRRQYVPISSDVIIANRCHCNNLSGAYTRAHIYTRSGTHVLYKQTQICMQATK